MVRAMEAGTGVLADLNAEIGGAEGVQRVMDAVREGVVEAEEINGVIGELGAEGVDEGEVEEEMAALEKQESERLMEKKRVEEVVRSKVLESSLPNVPTTEVAAAEKDDVVTENMLKKRLSDMSLDMEGEGGSVESRKEALPA